MAFYYATLAPIGLGKRHPSVTEAETGNLDRHHSATTDYDLMAPAKPAGLARIGVQRSV